MVRARNRAVCDHWRPFPHKPALDTPLSFGTDYSLRVILDTTGQRELRVVGVGVGSQPHAYQPFTVQVHR